MADFLSKNELQKYSIREHQTYFPDYLVNANTIIEIKPQKLCKMLVNIAKNLVCTRFCEKENFIYKLLTETDLTILSHQQIQAFVLLNTTDFIFYRTKDQKYFQNQISTT